MTLYRLEDESEDFEVDNKQQKEEINEAKEEDENCDLKTARREEINYNCGCRVQFVFEIGWICQSLPCTFTYIHA